jgi:DNA-directed RNA polymerase subunit M/transcription elongation factor TFIIS
VKKNMKSTRVPAFSCPSCQAVLMVCTSQVGAVTACPACRQEIAASVRPFTVKEFREYMAATLEQFKARRLSPPT